MSFPFFAEVQSPKSRQAVLYTIPNNPECKRAREFLLLRGVSFEEQDVSKSAAALEEMIRLLPGSKPPVLKTPLATVAGFDDKRFLTALSLQAGEKK